MCQRNLKNYWNFPETITCSAMLILAAWASYNGRGAHAEEAKTKGEAVSGPVAEGKGASLPRLPYSEKALEPVISARTMEFHYGKHHKAYVDKVHELLKGSPLAMQPLEDIVKASFGKPDQVTLFNNAAQVWNHDFYWKSIRPKGGGNPKGEMMKNYCSGKCVVWLEY